MMPTIRIELAKKDFGFAAAHMTVFSKNHKEPLHGHNYRVSLTIEAIAHPIEKTIPFAELKKPIRDLCAQWDEKVLLAEKCPYLEIHSRNPLRVTVCNKPYEFPADEVVLLPIENASCEDLCQHLCREYTQRIQRFFKRGQIASVSLTVWESEGQGVTCSSSL